MDDPGRRCDIRLTRRQSRKLFAAVSLALTGVVVSALVLRSEAQEQVEAAEVLRPPRASFASSPPLEASALTALGPSFPADLQVRPTGDAGQSKLWFHDGRWWGILLAEGEFRIHAFDPGTGWADTGTVVDARATSHADVLSEGDALVVVSAGRGASASNAVGVRRFTYDAAAAVYRADKEFPVRISDTGARHVTITRSAAGVLWVALVADQRLEVAHTVDADTNWTEPATLPIAESAEPVDAAAVAAHGDVVAVLAATTAGSVFAASTRDGETWTSKSLLSGAFPDERRVVALRSGPEGGPAFLGLTELTPSEEGEGNGLSPHLVLFASADGTGWSSHAVSRIEDRLRDPTLVVDAADGSAVVLASAEGTVWMKRAPLDDLVFGSGRGTALLPADVGALFTEPTTARVIGPREGLLVLAADGGIGRYGHAALEVPEVEGGAGRAEDSVLLAELFDGRPIGSGPPPGWVIASEAGSGELSLAPGLEGLALRLATAGGQGSARACRRFIVGAPAPITVSVAVRFAGGGSGDAALASVRGAGETASVRVDERGRVAWFDGDEKKLGRRTLAPSTWYRVAVRLHPESRTYDFVVSDPAGSVITEAEGARWRSATATFPEQLCVSTREGATAEMHIDEVEVRR